jgi:hypothetical protein
VSDHPQYAMWNARYKAEQAAERERVIHRTQRDALRTGWEKTWEEYKSRRREHGAACPPDSAPPGATGQPHRVLTGGGAQDGLAR